MTGRMISGFLGTAYDTRYFRTGAGYAWQRTSETMDLPDPHHTGHVIGNAVLAPFVFGYYLLESFKLKRTKTPEGKSRLTMTLDDRVETKENPEWPNS